MEIEDSLFCPCLPVNSLAILHRIHSLLDENETNSILCLKGEALERIRACLMLLMLHAYGDLFVVDSVEEYSRLKKALNK